MDEGRHGRGGKDCNRVTTSSDGRAFPSRRPSVFLKNAITKYHFSGEREIVHIFKKRNNHKPKNYRPVPLISIFLKFIEHILVSNICKHLDSNIILVDGHYGFRSKRSYEYQIFTFSQYLFCKVSNNSQVDAVVINFSKAFDKVPTSPNGNTLPLEHSGEHKFLD